LFAGPMIIDIGRELQSTATCIFVPVIFLKPSYPVRLPLFWQELLMNQLIFSAGLACFVCELILLNWTESFSRFLEAKKNKQ